MYKYYRQDRNSMMIYTKDDTDAGYNIPDAAYRIQTFGY